MLDVPLVAQRGNWCGYASLSMVLQFWGYGITQEDIWRQINGPDAPFTHSYEDAARGIGDFVLAARAMTDLRVDLIAHDHYDRPDFPFTPRQVLLAQLGRGRPCMIRVPQHYVVTTGREGDWWSLNDPAYGGARARWHQEKFERYWSHRDPKLRYDSRHLILVARPK